LFIYEGCMTFTFSSRPPLAGPKAIVRLALGLSLGAALGGCAGMSDSMTLAFADPAKYDLYECKQLEVERKSLAVRAAELQGLMSKAETGAAGSVVAEIAYRNEYVSVRGRTKLAEDAWSRNKCHDSPPSAEASGSTLTPLARTKSRRPAASSGNVSSGSAVY
jgi:hypothetical protein